MAVSQRQPFVLCTGQLQKAQGSQVHPCLAGTRVSPEVTVVKPCPTYSVDKVLKNELWQLLIFSSLLLIFLLVDSHSVGTCTSATYSENLQLHSQKSGCVSVAVPSLTYCYPRVLVISSWHSALID